MAIAVKGATKASGAAAAAAAAAEQGRAKVIRVQVGQVTAPSGIWRRIWRLVSS